MKKEAKARPVAFNEEIAVEKAMNVFWEKGYASASLRDLTEAMQINSSSLYNTIGDKHQLFVRCIKSYTENKMKAAEKRAHYASTPLTTLINLINDSVEMVVKGERSCMSIKTTFEIVAKDPEIQNILKKERDFTHHFVCTLFKEAMKQDEITKKEAPEILTDYLLSLLTGWYESFIIHKNPKRIRQMADYLITTL